MTAGSLTEVLPSALAAVGDVGFDDTLAVGEATGGARRIVVLLADGLGHHLLARSPALSAVASHGRLDKLACALPSTTPTSLVSLATGVGPGEHGVLGMTLNIPGTDRTITHIFWRDDPNPDTWQPIPTVFERARVPTAAALPAAFIGSGLTRATYRGARLVGVAPEDDLARAALGALEDCPVVVGYVADIDTAAHRHGIASPQWQRACADVAALIERIVAGLPADAAVLVTADHGGLDIPAGTRVDVGADARLRAGVSVVAGEPRMRYLHVEPGAADDVLATWRGVLGHRARVESREEAVASGMFGAVAPGHLARIGDVVVTCLGDAAVLATDREPDVIAQLVGMHGAATDVETAIPLLSLATG